MTFSSPQVTVVKTDHADRTGVTSFVSLKFVYSDGHVAYVHLDADRAQVLGIQLELVAAEVKPELVG